MALTLQQLQTQREKIISSMRGATHVEDSGSVVKMNMDEIVRALAVIDGEIAALEGASGSTPLPGSAIVSVIRKVQY